MKTQIEAGAIAALALISAGTASAATVDTSTWIGATGNTAVSTTGLYGYGYVGVEAGNALGMFGGSTGTAVHNNTPFGSIYENVDADTFGTTKLLTTVGGTYTNVTFTEGAPSNLVDYRTGADGWSFDGIATYNRLGSLAGAEQDVFTLTFNDLGVNTFDITVYSGHSNSARILDMDYSLTGGITGTTITGQTFDGTTTTGSAARLDALNGDAAGGFATYNITVTTTAATDDLSLSFGSISGGSGNAYLAGYTIAAVPEPSTALLGGLGALFLLRRRRI